MAAAASPVSDGRHTEVEVAEGILCCPGCGRWFPIRDALPELLPDHLRSRDEDRAWLNHHLDTWPHTELKEIGRRLIESVPPSDPAPSDEGARYKIAEMGITRRSLPESFWGPTLVAPFYPQRPDFSLDLLARFTTTLQRLQPGIDALLLDICAGFAWTSEWLVRMGFRAVAVDLCRDSTCWPDSRAWRRFDPFSLSPTSKTFLLPPNVSTEFFPSTASTTFPTASGRCGSSIGS